MSGDDRQNSPSISRQNRPSATIGVKIVLHLAQLFHIGNIEFSLLRQRERDGAAVKDLAADAILGAAHHRADCRLADEERFCRL